MLIQYFSRPSNQQSNKGAAIGYGVGITMCTFLNILIKHPTMMSELHTGIKMKAALSSVIYRKALKVTQAALSDISPGQVVNLMANDVSRFELFLSPLHYIWIGPIQMFVAAAILYEVVSCSRLWCVQSCCLDDNRLFFFLFQVSFAVFIGVAFIVLLIPLQRKLTYLRLTI